MTNQSESQVLSLLRDQYEEEGYTFIEHPKDAQLPAFIRGYRPDAIAVGKDKFIVIEVKSRRGAVSGKTLQALSERFKGQDHWELRVVYSGDVSDETIPVPTLEQIEMHIREAETLLAQNHPRAALVLGWAAIEAIARTLDSDFPSKGSRTMRQAVEFLEHLGRLHFDEAQVLRKLLPLRSKVVHGDFGTPITSEEVEPVLKAAREALNVAA